MPTRFDLVTIDAVDAARLVTFWSVVLQFDIVESEDDGRWTVLGRGAERRLGVQRISDLGSAVAPTWAGPTKPRLHLDLACDPSEFAAEVERLITLGATRLRADRIESYGSIATLADPEGNVFDLCAYNSSHA
jgi:predicted enzyme related to lactoylglutathione lyase